MEILNGSAQYIGKREEQQDAFGFSDINDAKFVSNSGFLAVIADGIGGFNMGKEASNLAVKIMLNEYASILPKDNIKDILYEALIKSNIAIYNMAKKANIENSGTTLSAAVIHNDNLYWISVGDSRIYLFRDGQITLLTIDHTYYNELLKGVMKGELSKEEIKLDPDINNALVSYLGLPSLNAVEQNIKPFMLRSNDLVILCTDGLYNTLTEQEIIDLMDVNPLKFVDNLVTSAVSKNKKNQDNITISILLYKNKKDQKRENVENYKFYFKIIIMLFLITMIGILGFVIGRLF